MLDGLVKMIQNIPKFPKLEWIFRKMINNISAKTFTPNIPKSHELSCALVFYVKCIILLSLFLYSLYNAFHTSCDYHAKSCPLNKKSCDFHWRSCATVLLTIEYTTHDFWHIAHDFHHIAHDIGVKSHDF